MKRLHHHREGIADEADDGDDKSEHSALIEKAEVASGYRGGEAGYRAEDEADVIHGAKQQRKYPRNE